jgi:murein DD-endopeptidase MepM/ murein hydrolase activator NlpD
MRFNTDGYGNPVAGGPPPNQIAPGQPAPVGRIETQPLPQPPTAEVTGSVRSAGGGHWDSQGGTPVVVAQGETIGSIAQRYKVPSQAIMQANGITNAATIQPGQRLVIPRYVNQGGPAKLAHAALPRNVAAQPAAPAPSGPSEHVIASGETLTSIAHKHRIPLRVLTAANNITPETPLKVGTKLTIPAKSAPPVARATPAGATPTKPVQLAQAKPTGPTLASAKPSQPSPSVNVATEAEDAAPAGTAGMPAFRWPLRGRVVTNFGAKTAGGSSDGIDLAVPEGTAIRAADDGVVAYAGNELKGYGNLVLVRHANGFVTAYANASEISVKRNDQVHRGQVIAKSGQTGTAPTPQLHFEIRKNSAPVDPMQYLPSDKTASAPL